MLQAVNVIVSGTTEDVWAQRGEEVWDISLDDFVVWCIHKDSNDKGIEALAFVGSLNIILLASICCSVPANYHKSCLSFRKLPLNFAFSVGRQ